MGLDVSVYEFVEIPADISTEEQLQAFCDEHDYGWTVYEERHKNFPKKWLKEIPIEFTDFEASFKALGLNYDDYEWFMQCGPKYGFVKKGCQPDMPDDEEEPGVRLAQALDKDKPRGNTIYLEGDQVKTKMETVQVFVYGREVGYQRKGANAQFYEDGKWDDNTIVSTEEMLLEDWKKYFSDPDDPYYGEKAREAFHYNIIKHFREGKTFVWYA